MEPARKQPLYTDSRVDTNPPIATNDNLRPLRQRQNPTTTTGRTAAANDNQPNDSTRTVSGTYNEERFRPQGIARNQQEKNATAEQTAIRDRIRQTEQALLDDYIAEERQRASAIAQPLGRFKPRSTKVAAAAIHASSRTEFFWIMGIHVWIWLNVQLFLAIAAMAFLGIGALLATTWLGQAASWVTNTINSITSFFGLDFSALSPTNISIALNFVLFGLMLLVLFATVFYYKMTFRRPFSGSAAAAKIGAFLLAFVGYGMPVANLFPWILLYTFVMWRHPR